MDDLAGKIFALLKGNGLQIKIFDDAGAETTDPNVGRRFFIADPNIMVTIDDESNEVEFSKGADVESSVDRLQKTLRHYADTNVPPMNFTIKVFGKTIQPRDFAYDAKMKKNGAMMENSLVQPYNHQLVGTVLHNIRNHARVTVDTLSSDLKIDRSDIQPILNKLVTDGKIEAQNYRTGKIEYVMSVDEAVMESFSKMFGSIKTSQQTLENVRILVRHKTPVDENIRGARSRHISAIFLECNGERFRFPQNYLPGARAMAQHMAHGGLMGDKVGAYISESTGQLLKLQSFNRYVTTNKLINEDSSGIVDTVKENIETLRTELRKLTGTKTYETVKARLETFEREPLAEDDTSTLKELFTIRRFDEKFEGVLPIIKQLVQEKDTFHKRIEEAAAGIVMIRSGSIPTPIYEFASDYARLGFMLNELALRIVENDELSGFVNKVGTKLCKEGTVNDFERAVMAQVFENAKIEDQSAEAKTPIKESTDLEAYFDRFDYKFM